MIVTLDTHEKEELLLMLKANEMALSLFDIQQEIFRPVRKHGYKEKEINDLIELCGEDDKGYNNGAELVGKLEDKFYEILEDRGLLNIIL